MNEINSFAYGVRQVERGLDSLRRLLFRNYNENRYLTTRTIKIPGRMPPGNQDFPPASRGKMATVGNLGKPIGPAIWDRAARLPLKGHGEGSAAASSRTRIIQKPSVRGTVFRSAVRSLFSSLYRLLWLTRDRSLTASSNRCSHLPEHHCDLGGANTIQGDHFKDSARDIQVY